MTPSGEAAWPIVLVKWWTCLLDLLACFPRIRRVLSYVPISSCFIYTSLRWSRDTCACSRLNEVIVNNFIQLGFIPLPYQRLPTSSLPLGSLSVFYFILVLAQ
ncbi:hypothetical protein J3F84DRAFT_368473 [Trichoderma pleuroticola]